MEPKLCSECGEAAEVSLCQILSTVGRGDRKQQCSTATPFCATCYGVASSFCNVWAYTVSIKPLGEAFTTLAGRCGMKWDRPKRSNKSLVA